MGLGSGIRDPGSRGQKGTGSRTRIRNTAAHCFNDCNIKNLIQPIDELLAISNFTEGVPGTKQHCISHVQIR
jgi:hypothetical protein